MKGASTADSRKRVRWMGKTSKSRQKEIARQAAGSPEQNQAINQDVKERFLDRAKNTHRNPIYDDAEALKAVRYLASKYTAEEIINQWWRMERGK